MSMSDLDTGLGVPEREILSIGSVSEVINAVAEARSYTSQDDVCNHGVVKRGRPGVRCGADERLLLHKGTSNISPPGEHPRQYTML